MFFPWRSGNHCYSRISSINHIFVKPGLNGLKAAAPLVLK